MNSKTSLKWILPHFYCNWGNNIIQTPDEKLQTIFEQKESSSLQSLVHSRALKMEKIAEVSFGQATLMNIVSYFIRIAIASKSSPCLLSSESRSSSKFQPFELCYMKGRKMFVLNSSSMRIMHYSKHRLRPSIMHYTYQNHLRACKNAKSSHVYTDTAKLFFYIVGKTKTFQTSTKHSSFKWYTSATHTHIQTLQTYWSALFAPWNAI